jgi:tRNA pseudouridine13 synthase
MLALYLRRHVDQRYLISVDLRLGASPMQRGVPEPVRQELDKLQLPLPSGRIEMSPDDPRHQVLEAILKEEGIEQEQWKLKGCKGMFFSRGDRPAVFVPAAVHHEDGADELNPERLKLVLAFELPRGSYATLLVKRITAGPGNPLRD